MNPVSSIATSGMAAATRRLEVSARNVANVLSAGPLPSANATVTASFSAYVPLRVDQVETAGGGTAANVSPVSPSQVPAYDPDAPYADANGMVATPNVDLADEIVQQMVARYTFAANAGVMRTNADMMKSLLDVKV